MLTPRRRLGGALLAALALTTAPATATAADPAPPKACATTTGYSADGHHAGELTVCLTETMIHDSLLGHEMPRPATSVEARCWTRDTLWSWNRNERNCEIGADLTLAKDGDRLWTEPRALRTDHLHSGGTTSLNSWTCEGAGTYTLTLHHITMRVIGPASAPRVDPAPVTAAALGC